MVLCYMMRRGAVAWMGKFLYSYNMDFKKKVLDNGLRIITIPQPNAVAMTALVLVETGSKYETKENSGIAHFLEHMCFKGTTTRPKPMQISSELDSLGAQSNAFTGHEYTGYYAKASADKAMEILDIIADLYINPIFSEDEIEKEKGVIIEELNMYEDMPHRKAGDYFLSLLYGDQPAGWDIGGDREVIKNAKRQDFLDFRERHYMPKATTLILVGKIDEEKMVEQAKRLFADMENKEKADKLPVKEAQNKPEVFLKEKKSDQAHIVLGYRALDMNDERRFALEVLGDVLGGGMSSRLFALLREKMGAAYYVGAGADLFTDHGYIEASAGIQLAKIDEAIKGILEEFKKLREEKISDEELERAKNHLTGSLLLGLETSDSLAVFYGIQELLKKEITTTDDLIRKIESVTAEDIQKLAQQLFAPENLNLVVIGPFEDKKRFEDLLV
ncbi:MAG: hypothetical protein COU09_00465 [Candidatus Harrisonbacteria bacterium CG10_big_fil_rev_8_21_14_0_10_44_23]|uniref:Peptidase M16 n=1 Tax=Candidatus Harrisonbacteria bacterium CG10_big_fil_rev_8_21_14_0_10_44_23 TaxID=1974585 RepID=A0A2H0USX1_9BACT|nr:MAG: hypothetical protein COU09_00465 [Candidatus Harrisonbacteria bacterium CG10_big_fil_rev_8_21_14_0_10_44_23]